MKMEETQERALQRNIHQDVNEMLYNNGIRDPELEQQITDMVANKWKSQKGLD